MITWPVWVCVSDPELAGPSSIPIDWDVGHDGEMENNAEMENTVVGKMNFQRSNE